MASFCFGVKSVMICFCFGVKSVMISACLGVGVKSVMAGSFNVSGVRKYRFNLLPRLDDFVSLLRNFFEDRGGAESFANFERLSMRSLRNCLGGQESTSTDAGVDTGFGFCFGLGFGFG